MGRTMTVAHDPSVPSGHLPGFAREERVFSFPPYAQHGEVPRRGGGVRGDPRDLSGKASCGRLMRRFD